MIAEAWGFTAAAATTAGVMSILLLFAILCDLFRRRSFSDGFLIGVLVLYGMASVLAALGLAFSVLLSLLAAIF